MPTVTSKGQVTIPQEVREALGIRPGDEVDFVETDEGYRIEKVAPTTAEGADPFEKYRGMAEGDASMSDRMGRLRGGYPRTLFCRTARL